MGKKNRAMPTPLMEHPQAESVVRYAPTSFVVYEIQNGYLLSVDCRLDAAPIKLIYCKDIQDLTQQILSSQAQLRLGLSSAKINKY